MACFVKQIIEVIHYYVTDICGVDNKISGCEKTWKEYIKTKGRVVVIKKWNPSWFKAEDYEIRTIEIARRQRCRHRNQKYSAYSSLCTWIGCQETPLLAYVRKGKYFLISYSNERVKRIYKFEKYMSLPINVFFKFEYVCGVFIGSNASKCGRTCVQKNLQLSKTNDIRTE